MYDPLKVYFESTSSCPRNVKRAFEDETFLFWLKFIEAQLMNSNKYVLKAESRVAAAFEVASDLASLRDLVDRRKRDNFIPFEARADFEKLSDSKQVALNEDVKSFYSSLFEYLDKWSKSLDGNEIFMWMKLDKKPDFEKEILPAARYFVDHYSTEELCLDGLYDEFPLIEQFVENMLNKWSTLKTSAEDRWIQLLKSLSDQNRPVPNFKILAQYAFAVPGTSTEVERLFSIIKGIWGCEKGQMSHKTLEAHLNIKFNSKLSCQEFFDDCKQNKKILAKVQGGEKYKNVTETSPLDSNNVQSVL